MYTSSWQGVYKHITNLARSMNVGLLNACYELTGVDLHRSTGHSQTLKEKLPKLLTSEPGTETQIPCNESTINTIHAEGNKEPDNDCKQRNIAFEVIEENNPECTSEIFNTQKCETKDGYMIGYEKSPKQEYNDMFFTENLISHVERKGLECPVISQKNTVLKFDKSTNEETCCIVNHKKNRNNSTQNNSSKAGSNTGMQNSAGVEGTCNTNLFYEGEVVQIKKMKLELHKISTSTGNMTKSKSQQFSNDVHEKKIMINDKDKKIGCGAASKDLSLEHENDDVVVLGVTRKNLFFSTHCSTR